MCGGGGEGHAERGTQTCMLAPVDEVSTDAYKVEPLPVLRKHSCAVEQPVVDAVADCLNTWYLQRTRPFPCHE